MHEAIWGSRLSSNRRDVTLTISTGQVVNHISGFFFLAAAQCRSYGTLMQDADLSLFCAFVKSSPIVRPAVTCRVARRKMQDARSKCMSLTLCGSRLEIGFTSAGANVRVSHARDYLITESTTLVQDAHPRTIPHFPYISLQLDAIRQLIKKNNPSRKLSAAIPQSLRYSPAHAAACLRCFVGVKFLSCISLIYMCQNVAPAL